MAGIDRNTTALFAMSWTDEIHASFASWCSYREKLEELRKVAERQPADAAFAFELVSEELRQLALSNLYFHGIASPQLRYARRLGKTEAPETEAEIAKVFYETYNHDRERYEQLAAEGYFDLPKKKEELHRKGPSLNFDEEIRSTLAAMLYGQFSMARYLMKLAGEKARAAGENYYGPAVCDVFLEVYEQAPVVFAGLVQEKWGGDARTRRKAAVSLTGWVRSHISLDRSPRLKLALQGEHDISAYQRLLEELPGAVAIEWGALQRDAPLRLLVRRSTLLLDKGGDQISKPHLKDKLAAREPDEEYGTEEPELDQFMLQEHLRTLKEAAKLSELEFQVLELALEEYTGREIAERLGVVEGTVKTVKSRARKKLRAAAGQ